MAIERRHRERDAPMGTAYATKGYSDQQLAEHFGAHFTIVGRVVRQAKGRG